MMPPQAIFILIAPAAYWWGQLRVRALAAAVPCCPQ